jgi:unsaturated chondroitin disaccharide hydrolase
MDTITRVLTDKVAHSVREFGDSLVYPRSAAAGGTWKTVHIRDWTSGFFPGILWYMHEMTGGNQFLQWAQRWTEGLTPLQLYSGSHDVGFMVFCSFGNGYRLTKAEPYKTAILRSAGTLATRFNHRVGCIKSWDNRRWGYPVIIDNMMNLELLFWASQNGGPRQLYDIAVKHAETTMRNHFRSDGSTYHVLSYDTTNGSVIWRGTHQGYADGSCWSRGQAWAIYGFTMSYRFTRDPRFLQTAQRAAEYYIDHLPADHVPYWDFNAPGIPGEPRDASAAAIAAAALLELSRFVDDAPTKEKYFHAAVATLEALSAQPYFSEDSTSTGVLKHAVGSKPSGSEVDVSLIYGDYYYIEALLRYKQYATEQLVGGVR